MKKIKPIIGRDDIVDFPLFGLTNVPVKIDSGAFTSTIHCAKIKEEDGLLKVIFLSKKHTSYTGETIQFSEYSEKKVKSSNGVIQERYKVKGNIQLFGKKYTTEFTLSKRSSMKYPVLLGRKLLNKRFLIDTSLSNQSYQNMKKTSE